MEKKKLALIIVLAALLLGGGFVISRMVNSNSGQGDESSTEGLNLNPPTDQDLAETEQHKKDLSNLPASPPSRGGVKTVTPIITSWGQAEGKVEVAARVPGVFEDNGTCTLNLRKDDRTVTASQTATPNVSEVSCGFISVLRSKLSNGEWSVTVEYSSAEANGVSSPKPITIQ